LEGKYSFSKFSMMEPLNERNENIQVPQKRKYPKDNPDAV